MKLPWTPAELAEALPQLRREIEETEEAEGARPLPPMTLDECLAHFTNLLGLAAERPLTRAECFLHGQLLCVFQHAVRAEMFGKKGRFFVFGEAEINRRLNQLKGGKE